MAEEPPEVVEVVTEEVEVVPVPALSEVLPEVEVPPVAPLEVSMPPTRRPSLLLEHRGLPLPPSLAYVHHCHSYSKKSDLYVLRTGYEIICHSCRAVYTETIII